MTDWSGPWLVLAEVALWLTVVPLMAGYWFVSQDLPQAFIAPVLTAAGLLAVGLLLATGNTLSLIILAAAMIWALATWSAVLWAEGHADPNNPARLLLARSHLTGLLAFCGATASALVALGLVDGVGRSLARIMMEGGLTATNVGRWFMGAGMIILSVAGMLRMVARSLIDRESGTSEVLEVSRPYFWAILMLIVGSLPPLIVLSFASHAAYELGSAYWQGFWLTVGAFVMSLLLGSRACVQFINRSSPLGIYAARLATAFLGAVNPERRTHPEGRNVTHIVPGDDVPLSKYSPEAAGGPLHLINCAVNETVDVASLRGLRDRQAENLAIGPAGVNIAQQWHALWDRQTADPDALVPLAPYGGPHPFLASGNGPIKVEPLTLREWTAISGAALGPGMGGLTGTGRSLLLTLANIRLGYWWNSGLNVNEREDVPVRGGLWRTLTDFVGHWFRAQSLLVSELLGRFGGPWYRYWYLSDGGNFENTGAYELLRRRVPFVIVCDGTQDKTGSDLANLIRLARVDFGAEVQTSTSDPAVLQRLGVRQDVAVHLGSLNDLMPSSGISRTHAVLLLVRYPSLPSGSADDPWVQRRHTWLLYLKATLTGDEPADIRNYATLHPSFPNETTFNQFFVEPQWESYRKLGEHIGDNLF
jgi:hypothetical protein